MGELLLGFGLICIVAGAGYWIINRAAAWAIGRARPPH
jgi:hypothetical protein